MSVSFNLNGEFIKFTTKQHNRMDGKYDLPNFIYCNLQNLQMTLTPLQRSSCSTSGASHVTLVTNVMISHEGGNDRGVLTTSRPYPWSFVTDTQQRLIKSWWLR